MNFFVQKTKTFYPAFKLHYKNFLLPVLASILTSLFFSLFASQLLVKLISINNYDLTLFLSFLFVGGIGYLCHYGLFVYFFSSKQGQSLKAFVPSAIKTYFVFILKYFYIFLGHLLASFYLIYNLGYGLKTFFLVPLFLLFSLTLSFASLMLTRKAKKNISLLFLLGFIFLLFGKKLALISLLICKFSLLAQNFFPILAILMGLFIFIFLAKFSRIFYCLNLSSPRLGMRPDFHFPLDRLFNFFKASNSFIAKDIILIFRRLDYWLLLLTALCLTPYFSQITELYCAFIIILSFLLAIFTMECYHLEIKNKALLRLLAANNVKLLKNKYILGVLINIFLNLFLLLVGLIFNRAINFKIIACFILVPFVLNYLSLVIYQLLFGKLYVALFFFSIYLTFLVIFTNSYLLLGQIPLIILASKKGCQKVRRLFFE